MCDPFWCAGARRGVVEEGWADEGELVTPYVGDDG